MSEEVEIWRSVVGFEGLYDVSSFGRVKSLPRKTKGGLLGGKILKLKPESNGYIRVTLCNDGIQKRELLHRLVLIAFIGDCPKGQECRHKDGKRFNCRLSNLEWGTRSENAYDRVAHGTHVNNKGEKHPLTRLTDEQAKEIIRLRRKGLKLAEIAKMFSVSSQTVCHISRGKTWTHIKMENQE